MLVKLPREVGKVMNKLESAGFQAYVTGNCVRESILGEKPYGWDLSTNAGLDKLKELFPEAEVLSQKFGVVRLEYIEDILDKEGNKEGEDGIILDIAPFRREEDFQDGKPQKITFVETIEQDLARRDFTVNAIAEDQGKIIDPCEGREDMRKRLIKTVGDADQSFKRDPIRMLRAVRLAAQMGFDLHKSVYEAIVNNHKLLEKVGLGKIRDEFTELISAEHAGKGLIMLMDSGMLNEVIGEKTVSSLTRREMQDLTTLGQKIDLTKMVPERRLGLFFCCMDKKKSRPLIEKFNFDETTRQHLMDAANDLPKLYFTGTKPALKKFIYERGWERYDFLVSMEKAQRIVFEYFSETKIKSKMYLLEEIKKYREPIFPDELKIDANDLVEAGICTPDRADKILGMVTEEIHTHPRKNTREELLKLAKIYSKNKFRAAMRGIHWAK